MKRPQKQKRAAQPLTPRLPGNAARPALPAQSRYRRGLGVPAGRPDSQPHPLSAPLRSGQSPSPRLPPSSTTAPGFSPSLGTPGSACQARGRSSGQGRGQGQGRGRGQGGARLGPDRARGPGLGEQRV